MSIEFEPEVAEMVRTLTARIMESSPVLATIIEEVRGGTVGEAEAMRRVMLAVKDDPELSEIVVRLASETFARLHVDDLLVPEARPVPRATPDPSSLVVPPPDGVGLPRLHPLYDAALQERISFDGDVPEARTGALPPGATPAVPVDTDARNPVALGWMLEAASEQVAAEVREIEGTAVAALGSAETSLTRVEGGALAVVDRAQLPDPVGYARGRVPAPVVVEPPEGWALTSLASEQRQVLTWKFLSTTQGRRTATRAIREILTASLGDAGYEVVGRDGEPLYAVEEDVLAYVEWTVGISSSASTQAGFAFVDTAAQALAKKLKDQVTPEEVLGATLEVVAINTVAARKVGWAARLVRAGGHSR